MEELVVSNRPILCGKCGTSSDVSHPWIITNSRGVQVACLIPLCLHLVESDSLPAALAKFEERVEAPK